MTDLLTELIVLGFVTYGITMLIGAESLFANTRTRIQSWLIGINQDYDYHWIWRIGAFKLEELMFCVRCMSYWVALVLVWWQVDGLNFWQILLAAFAARTVALVAWRVIDTNVEVVNR